MAAAALEEVQTELASRVAGWRTKIAPVLEEQDTRGDFDIHTCGSHASCLNITCMLPLRPKCPHKDGAFLCRRLSEPLHNVASSASLHAHMRVSRAGRLCQSCQGVACCMQHEAAAA